MRVFKNLSFVTWKYYLHYGETACTKILGLIDIELVYVCETILLFV